MFSKQSAKHILQSTFGYKNFKGEHQCQIIERLCKDQENIILSMPPGSGKSLCIQVATYLTDDKVTVVFSPKYFITKREVAKLRKKGISTAFLHNQISKSAENEIFENLESKNPTIRLLYCAPEYSTTIRFQDLINTLRRRLKIFYIVYDDACCLTQWGFDKLLSYRTILRDIELYCYLPNLILTRCITRQAIQEAYKMLNVRDPEICLFPAGKINIYHDVYFVESLQDRIGHLICFLLRTMSAKCNGLIKEKKEVTVIYCKDMEVGETLDKQLKDHGISSVLFTKQIRKQYSEESNWLPSGCKVLITVYNLKFCTETLVRSVVYWSVPLSIARYYNESHETYRIRETVHCRIYFSGLEYVAIAQNIKRKSERNGKKDFEGESHELEEVANYCLSIKCRYKLLSKYFGFTCSSCKKYCDICSDPSASKRIIEFFNYSWQSRFVDTTVWDIFNTLKLKNAKEIRRNLCYDASTYDKYKREEALSNSTERILVNSKYNSWDYVNETPQSKLLSSKRNSKEMDKKTNDCKRNLALSEYRSRSIPEDTISRTKDNVRISEPPAKYRKLNNAIVTSTPYISPEDSGWLSSIKKENDKTVLSKSLKKHSSSPLSRNGIKEENSSDKCEVLFIEEIKKTPKSRKRKRYTEKKVVEDKPGTKERVNKNATTAHEKRQRTSVKRVEYGKNAAVSKTTSIEHIMQKFNLNPNAITITCNSKRKREDND